MTKSIPWNKTNKELQAKLMDEDAGKLAQMQREIDQIKTLLSGGDSKQSASEVEKIKAQ